LITLEVVDGPSRPVRARGLKQAAFSQQIRVVVVAPRAGAWIETGVRMKGCGLVPLSRPVRARGLKPRYLD